MKFCEIYGFDPEYTVLLKGVPDKVPLAAVKEAFASLDEVVKVCRIDSLSHTILCQFCETITPMLLDSEHKVGDSYWEVIQIDEYQPPKSVNEPLSEGTVPLARAVGDLTVQFQEQVNVLALTYGMSPITLSQVAVNHICGRGEGVKGPVASTPTSALKLQPLPNLQRVDSGDVNSPSSGMHAPSDTLTINPLPADVQNVIVEHIVKCDSTVHFPQTRELRPFSGISPIPSVVGGLWHMAASSYSGNE